MTDDFSDIDRFQTTYQPQSSGIKPGVNALPEGTYDFEIIYAQLGKTSISGESIFRLGLRVISGPRAGTEIERPTFFRRQESIDYLGNDLILLGLDADQWAGRPSWSRELQKACPKLVGLRFVGQRRDKDQYQNLYVRAAISPTATPAPAPTKGPPPMGPAPELPLTGDADIPF